MRSHEHPCGPCTYADTKTVTFSVRDPRYKLRRKAGFPWVTFVLIDDGNESFPDHFCKRFPKRVRPSGTCGEYRKEGM